jgi:hypothetical protein
MFIRTPFLIAAIFHVAFYAHSQNQLPQGRYQLSLVYDVNEDRVVLFGGMNFEGNHLGDLWELKKGKWKLLSDTKDLQRSGHALSYDVDRKKIILFGGMGPNGPSADTWEYDGKLWSKIEVKGPPALVGAQLVYHQGEKIHVLFGGLDPKAKTNLGETWGYDGKAWRLLASSGPKGRFHHTMVYDRERKRIMLFGGNAAEGQLNQEKYEAGQQRDTWAFENSTWKELLGTGPSARDHHAMAYDAANKNVIVFGGFGGSYLSDTWKFDGSTWVKVEGGGPDARGGKPGMIFDEKENCIILFGGGIGGGSSLTPKAMNDTWSWDGVKWAQVQ